VNGCLCIAYPIALLIAFGSPYHSRLNGSAESDQRRNDLLYGGLYNGI